MRACSPTSRTYSHPGAHRLLPRTPRALPHRAPVPLSRAHSRRTALAHTPRLSRAHDLHKTPHPPSPTHTGAFLRFKRAQSPPLAHTTALPAHMRNSRAPRPTARASAPRARSQVLAQVQQARTSPPLPREDARLSPARAPCLPPQALIRVTPIRVYVDALLLEISSAKKGRSS